LFLLASFRLLIVSITEVDVQFDVIYSALEAYKAVYGDLFVPQKFIVPQGDVRFPVETWGMKLGCNVHTGQYDGR
jgi:hypothetical protein